jgi:hypothetical protein
VGTKTPMALAGSNNTHAPNATFNDVAQNQYNFQTTNIQLALPAILGQAVSSAKFIASTIPHININQEQIKALSFSISTLLRALDAEYSAGRLLHSFTSAALDKLNKSV